MIHRPWVRTLGGSTYGALSFVQIRPLKGVLHSGYIILVTYIYISLGGHSLIIQWKVFINHIKVGSMVRFEVFDIKVIK